MLYIHIRGTVRLQPGDKVLSVNTHLCKFSVLKNCKGSFTSFWTKTFLGTHIDHLEFTVYRAFIRLFLKNHERYVSSVYAKSFLGSFQKKEKKIENILIV